MKRLLGKRRKPLSRDPNEGGFTLIEVIVAIGILSFGILAVATMQVSAIRGNAVAEWDTEATTWAGDQVENLACLDWDEALPVTMQVLMTAMSALSSPETSDIPAALRDSLR